MENIYINDKRLVTMNVPIIIIYIALLSLLPFVSYNQQYIQTPAIGIHLQALNFQKSDSSSIGATKMGLALGYQNNLSSRFMYNTTLSGAFIEEAGKNEGKKEMFLQADLSIRVNYFKTDKVFNPYAQAGVGVSKYMSDYSFIVPVGIGCQVNLSRDVFLLINSQYRFSTDRKYNHWVNSIGIAGVISRKKISKIKQVPLYVASRTAYSPVDTDGDGILDKEDSCRLIVGVIKYHGCPPPPSKGPEMTEIKQQINLAATRIFFETGSYKLLPQSYTPLNEVAQILKDNPLIQLIIEGHTDNEGTPSSNQLLSLNRAQTVFSYLINAGIGNNRLQYQGFGQSRPIADNSTLEGKAKNRRVELRAF